MSYRSRRAFTRLAKPVAAMAALVVVAGCASDSEADAGGFADDAAGGGADSVVFAEQPWVDLQVENEIAVQILEQLGYDASIKRNLSVENAASALGTGDLDAYLGNWWPSQEPTFGELIDEGKVGVVSTIVTGTEYAPAVPGDVADDGISSLADLDEHADEFDRKIYGIEAGSPGNETIQKAIDEDAYGLEDWELVASGTPAMLAQVEKSEKAGDPIVFLAWSPHWMTVQFDTVFLEDPEKVWGGAGEIRTLTREASARTTRRSRRSSGTCSSPPTRRGVLLRPRQGRPGAGRDRLGLDRGEPRQGRLVPRRRRGCRRQPGRGELLVMTAVDTAGRVAVPGAAADGAARETAIVGRNLTKAWAVRPAGGARPRAAGPCEGRGRRGGFLAAHDVSFTIRRGEMFVVMGLSGSGKSTVLRMVNRLNEPTSGHLEIEGEDITQVSDARLRELRNEKIGMVFQHFSLFAHRGAGQRGVRPQGARRGEGRNGAAPTRPCTGSGSETAATSSRTSSPAGCASASASPGRSPSTRRSSSWTSRSRRST